MYRFFFFLDQTFTKKKEIPKSILISIGNLSVGGTGKTPFTIFLIEFLRCVTELPVCVLSRGYKGINSNKGMRVELDSISKLCGDEPLLIKKSHPNVEVIIGKNRYESFLRYSNFIDQKKIILLDDGFQHHALKRNYDFVLIDSSSLLGNGYTLPYGLLREPIDSVKRAHSIVFTKYSQNYSEQVENLKAKLIPINPSLKFFYMYFTPMYLKNRDGHIVEIQRLKGKALCVFSGIGNFQSLKNTIQSFEPSEVKYITFPDHYFFSQEEVDDIIQANLDKQVVCTEKDFVKFLPWIFNQKIYEKIYFLVMQTKLEPENLFKMELQALLQRFS